MSALTEYEARQLVEQAQTYGADLPDVFGGAWFDYPGGSVPAVFAAFKGDLRWHRRALDRRIRVVTAEWTVPEREELVSLIEAFADAYDGVRVEYSRYSTHDGGHLIMEIEAADEEAFDRDLRREFGTLADVYYNQYSRSTQRIAQWGVDEGGRSLVVWWSGGPCADAQLVADEDAAEVRLTLTIATRVGTHRSPTSVGRGIGFGWAGPDSWEQSAATTLGSGIGQRTVVDAGGRVVRPIPRRGAQRS